MKRNAFGDAYCATADELRQEIENHVMTTSSVYATNLTMPEGIWGYTVEIAENVSGETVCYAEHETEQGIRDMLDELGIEQP